MTSDTRAILERIADVPNHLEMPELNELEVVEELLKLAWGIITNVTNADWEKQSKEWQQSEARWREIYDKLKNKRLRTRSERHEIHDRQR